MVNLGDLTKLLNAGHITDEYVYQSEDGTYKFKLKTLTPLEDDAARDQAEQYSLKNNEVDLNKRNIHDAVEILAIAITEVNDVSLEKVPGAKGETDLEKRRFILRNFSENLLLGLWKKYNDMRKDTSLSGDEQEDEAVKK